MKKFLTVAAAFLAVVACVGKGLLAYNQYQVTRFNDVRVKDLMIDTSNILDSGQVSRITFTGSVVDLPTSRLGLGSLTSAVSTATTSGTSNGSEITAYLDVGGSTVAAAVEGSIICASTVVAASGSNSVTAMVCPKTLGYAPWIGVAAAAASTGAVVNVYDSGWVLALTTGTVNPGDQVQVSTQSVGYLEKTAVSTATFVGVALAAGNPNGGLTRVKLR